MADSPFNPITVNPQVVDSVTTNSVNTLGSSPAQAMAILFQQGTQSASMSTQNMVQQQQQMAQLGQTATQKSIEQILKI